MINENSYPIYIPNYINEKIMKLSKHFGAIVEETILTGLSNQLKPLNESNIQSLNNIFKRKEINNKAVMDSLQEMSTPTANRITFWESILEANQHLGPSYQEGIKNIISLIEADSGPGTIEGDGEDPSPSPTPSGDSDQDPDADAEAAANGGDGQDPESQLSPDQLLQVELAQTDNKFLTIVLYDKIMELINTIDTIKDSVSASKTEETLNLFDDLMMYNDYLNILSELIFVMDINTVYYNFTNISLEVNSLLDKYLVSTKLKDLNDPKVSKEDKKSIIDVLKDNLDDKNETNQEIQDEGVE